MCATSIIGEESRLAINDIIEELQNIKSQSRSNERKACMTQLIRMSREGQITVIQDNFRYHCFDIMGVYM